MEVSNDFVVGNFPPAFIEQVVKEGEERKSKAFFHLPPGAPRTMQGHVMLDDRYPKLQYMQEGDFTCLFSSLASALFFLGLTRPAEAIASSAKTFASNAPAGIFNWNGLLMCMQSACKWLQPCKIHGNCFDVMKDISQYPTVLSLQAVDGGTQHAITIVGRMIFDSNCERALALTRRNLDYCCSSDDIQGYYKKVHKGYRFREVRGKNQRSVLDSLIERNNINLFMDDDITLEEPNDSDDENE